MPTLTEGRGCWHQSRSTTVLRNRLGLSVGLNNTSFTPPRCRAPALGAGPHLERARHTVAECLLSRRVGAARHLAGEALQPTRCHFLCSFFYGSMAHGTGARGYYFKIVVGTKDGRSLCFWYEYPQSLTRHRVLYRLHPASTRLNSARCCLYELA